MKSLPKSIALISALVVGVYLYRGVLPYYLSPQQPMTQDYLANSGTYNYADTKGTWHGHDTFSQDIPIQIETVRAVLGEAATSNKRIEVDLTNQRVYAFEGDTKVYEFLVSTGKWGRTPTGTFTIQYKTRAQKMSGGNRALGTYYYLPNVPYVQFFGNSEIPWSRGFSFHGTYWHDNFGHPMSHGCINMRTEDAGILYNWSYPALGDKATVKATEENPGTTVIIYGEAGT